MKLSEMVVELESIERDARLGESFARRSAKVRQELLSAIENASSQDPRRPLLVSAFNWVASIEDQGWRDVSSMSLVTLRRQAEKLIVSAE